MSEMLGTRIEEEVIIPPGPAVSWGAVFAGGVSAAAVGIMLSVCGAGMGLASVSPWQGHGLSLPGFTALAACWLIVVQWVAALVGGYMSGRLRTKYVAIHTDEVFFRDTAHGFLAWALSVVFTAVLLGAVSTSGASSGAAPAAASAALPTSYYTGLLFREPVGGGPLMGTSAPGVSDREIYSQAGTILAEAALRGNVPGDDRAYLAQLVSEKTGLSAADARKRVEDVLTREQADVTHAKQVANAARKMGAGALLYAFVSMLIGAFIASVAGAVGGRLRDSY